MQNSVQQVNKISSGLCPHGCAPGACPICSGMGTSGLRPGERAQKPGEMSYHQCAMIGAMMKARAARDEAHKQNLLKHAELAAKFEQSLMNLSQKMANLARQFSTNFFLKPFGFVINFVALPLVNFVKSFPSLIANISEKFNSIKEKFVDIQDKLNAIFGEAKAFLDKKISALISNIKSKLLFKIFKRNKTKDEETKIDEDKKIFKLKILISKIWKKKDDTENNSRS